VTIARSSLEPAGLTHAADSERGSKPRARLRSHTSDRVGRLVIVQSCPTRTAATRERSKPKRREGQRASAGSAHAERRDGRSVHAAWTKRPVSSGTSAEQESGRSPTGRRLDLPAFCGDRAGEKPRPIDFKFQPMRFQISGVLVAIFLRERRRLQLNRASDEVLRAGEQPCAFALLVEIFHG